MPLISRDPDVRADIRSFDGSYTCLHIRHGNTPLKVESAVKDGEQILMITPEGYYTSDEQLIVSIAFLWGRDGTLVKENGQLCGICPNGKRVTLYSNTAPYDFYLPEWQMPSLFYTLDSPVVISTVPYSTQEACRLMGELRTALLSEAQNYGTHAESYGAMQSCLAWNTIYDPCKDRICSPVSRNWNRGKGGTLFCWDTFFASLMFSLGYKKLSYLNVKAILDEMTEDGMIPNTNSRSGSNKDHSQPLVGSMVTEKIYERYGDVEFLREVYPKLLRWNTWFCENRTTEDGFMCWGSKTTKTGEVSLFGAKCESGMDNSPIFDDAIYDEKTGFCMVANVGLLGLFIKDCRALLKMAKTLGFSEDIEILNSRMERAENALLRLWNKEDGIFDNLDLITGKWVRRFSPLNFFALFSRKVSQEQKKIMVEKHLLNPEEFWGDYVIPSISRHDYAFAEQHYWRGRVWAPLNAIVYEALKDAEFLDEAKLLAEKSEKLFLIEWRKERHVHENYSAVDGLGCSARQSDAFYHWGGLLAYIAVDSGISTD